MTRFDRDTAVEPLGHGRYAARFDRAWWVARGPNGGHVGAVLVRAMEAELAAPDRQLRSIAVHYAAAPPEGAAEVAVRVERSGRALSSVSARLTAGDRVLALALAAFSTAYRGAAEYDVGRRPPALDERPERLPDPPGFEGPPFARNFRMLPTLGPALFCADSGDDVRGGGWMELAEPRPLDAALVVALTDAWWPVPFARLGAPAAAPTIDLTVHVRAPLPQPATPVLGEFDSTLLRDGFFEEDGRLYLPDGTLLAQSRQLALLLG